MGCRDAAKIYSLKDKGYLTKLLLTIFALAAGFQYTGNQ